MNVIAKTLFSVIRGLLFSVGGAITAWLLAKGLIDSTLAKELLDWLTGSFAQTVVSILLTFALPTVWAWAKNRKELQFIFTALNLEGGASVEKLKKEVALANQTKN